MKKENGFTLIEIIMVIVILGILSAFAIPKMFDATVSAKQSIIESISGSMEVFDKQIYGFSLIKNIQNNDRNVSTTNMDLQGGFYLNGNFVWTIYGHPWIFDGNTLSNLMDGSFQDEGLNDSSKVCNTDNDFCFMKFNGSGAPSEVGISFTPGNVIVVYLPGYKVSDLCFAYNAYDRATESPIIGNQLSGC